MNIWASDYVQDNWVSTVASQVGGQDAVVLSAYVDQLLAGLPSGGSIVEVLPEPSSAFGNLLLFYLSKTAEAVLLRKMDPQQAEMHLNVIRDVLAPPDAPPTALSAAAEPNAPSRAVTADEAALRDAIVLTYQLTVGRGCVEEEVKIWKDNLAGGLEFSQFLSLMNESEEARAKRKAEAFNDESPDGVFIVDLFRIVKSRGCSAQEVENIRRRLETGEITRQRLLGEFYLEALGDDRRGADSQVHDGLTCWIMGTSSNVSSAQWREKSTNVAELEAVRRSLKLSSPYRLKKLDGTRVSAIASLYRGGEFIEQFLDNITSQTVFKDSCELIIVDAQSPENEAETIERYLKSYENIIYRRMPTRVGIYEAWNIGVEMSRGQFLTNTNLDDLRRFDSFDIQAGALEEMPFVDVVYQDFYYSFDPNLDWKSVAAFGYKSDLPVLTPHNLLRYNSPHNAPMWRKSLHSEVGMFNQNLKSAGDWEFWLRCLAAGKQFFKINEPHVVYYQNPHGLSTRGDTRGVIEAKEITKMYVPKLIPQAFVSDFEEFLNSLSVDIDLEKVPSRDRHHCVQLALRKVAEQFKSGAA